MRNRGQPVANARRFRCDVARQLPIPRTEVTGSSEGRPPRTRRCGAFAWVRGEDDRASRAHPVVFATRTTRDPALIPHEAVGSSRRHPAIAAQLEANRPALAGNPAYPCPARKRQGRSVTPEVAGSSPVAPVKYLQIGICI